MAASVSARRQALAELARSRRAEGSAGRWIRRGAVAVILAALIGWTLLWLLGFFSTPREVLAVRALVDREVAALERVARNEAPLSSAEGSFAAMFETMRQVPEAYRGQARAEMGRLFAARERAEIDSYFGLPPAQRQAELDRRIQAEDARRRAWQAERAARENARGGGAPGDGRGRQSAGVGQAGGSAPRQAAAAGPPSGRRRRGDGTEETRNMRRKQRLDRSTAESRARRTEYRRLKDQRRIELGLEPRR